MGTIKKKGATLQLPKKEFLETLAATFFLSRSCRQVGG